MRASTKRILLLTLKLGTLAVGLSVPQAAQAAGGVNAGTMNSARERHTATLLTNGKVLVAGGRPDIMSATNGAELYDPASRTWTTTGSLNAARQLHTATLLPNGQVLVAGGFMLASAELYDPATGSWATTGSMSTVRYNHTATLLRSGQVLVAGGLDDSGAALASAELYDPASGTWSATGSLHKARDVHTATLLPNGQVLVAGGHNTGLSLASAELDQHRLTKHLSRVAHGDVAAQWPSAPGRGQWERRHY